MIVIKVRYALLQLGWQAKYLDTDSIDSLIRLQAELVATWIVGCNS